MNRTQGEIAFIEQMTRKLLVEWCNRVVLDDVDFICLTTDPYTEFALSKNWLSLKDPNLGSYKILSAGWKTATAFLKR